MFDYLKIRKTVAVDTGTGVGFSTTWMTKALYESGVKGKIYVVEKDI